MRDYDPEITDPEGADPDEEVILQSFREAGFVVRDSLEPAPPSYEGLAAPPRPQLPVSLSLHWSPSIGLVWWAEEYVCLHTDVMGTEIVAAGELPEDALRLEVDLHQDHLDGDPQVPTDVLLSGLMHALEEYSKVTGHQTSSLPINSLTVGLVTDYLIRQGVSFP